MKKGFVTILVISVLSMSALGQSIEQGLLDLGGKLISSGQARQERGSLSKAAAKYNADQPDVSLAGSRAVIRPPEEYSYYNNEQRRWMKSNISSIATAVDCHPVWDDKEIDEESASRTHHRSDREVDQSTLPGMGKIKYRSVILEYEFIDFEKSQEMEASIGRWWNQNSFRLSRETAYFGLTLTVREGDGGEVLAVYKTLGAASSADNIGAQIGDFFSSSVGFSSWGNSEEDRRFRAMENALREMGAVIKQKCG